tara:strand:+ start:1715 stop:2161 length:447 start_codon:yes stop_codon:yes gene_type:complete
MNQVQNLLINLKVLSQIGPGDKINTKEKNIEIDSNNWGQSLRRTYRGDDRKLTFDMINNLITTLTLIIQKSLNGNADDYIEEKSVHMTNKELLKEVHRELEGVRKGLENLRETYFQDATLASKMELCIGTVQRQITSIANYFNKKNNY